MRTVTPVATVLTDDPDHIAWRGVAYPRDALQLAVSFMAASPPRRDSYEDGRDGEVAWKEAIAQHKDRLERAVLLYQELDQLAEQIEITWVEETWYHIAQGVKHPHVKARKWKPNETKPVIPTGKCALLRNVKTGVYILSDHYRRRYEVPQDWAAEQEKILRGNRPPTDTDTTFGLYPTNVKKGGLITWNEG